MLTASQQNVISTGEHHLFVLVEAGEWEARCGGSLLDYGEGWLLIYPPQSDVTFNIQSHIDTRAWLVYITPLAAAALCPDRQTQLLVEDLFSPAPPTGTGPHKQSVKDSIKTMQPPLAAFQRAAQYAALIDAENFAARPLHRRIVHSVSTALLVHLAREYASSDTEALLEYTAFGPAERAMRAINTHYSEPLSLAGLAETLELTPAYLSALFKKETGRSYTEYLCWIRMLHAETMLLDSDELVTQIAEACGFGSAAHFGYIFKRQHGVSPLRFRKERRAAAIRRQEAGHLRGVNMGEADAEQTAKKNGTEV